MRTFETFALISPTGAFSLLPTYVTSAADGKNEPRAAKMAEKIGTEKRSVL